MLFSPRSKYPPKVQKDAKFLLFERSLNIARFSSAITEGSASPDPFALDSFILPLTDMFSYEQNGRELNISQIHEREFTKKLSSEYASNISTEVLKYTIGSSHKAYCYKAKSLHIGKKYMKGFPRRLKPVFPLRNTPRPSKTPSLPPLQISTQSNLSNPSSSPPPSSQT